VFKKKWKSLGVRRIFMEAPEVLMKIQLFLRCYARLQEAIGTLRRLLNSLCNMETRRPYEVVEGYRRF